MPRNGRSEHKASHALGAHGATSPSVLNADLQVGPDLFPGEPLSCSSSRELALTSCDHWSVAQCFLGELNQRRQRLREVGESRRCEHRTFLKTENGDQPTGHRRSHALHPRDVLCHACDFDLGPKHVCLLAVAYGVHDLGNLRDLLHEPFGLPRDVELSVRGVKVVESHRRACAHIPPNITNTRLRGGSVFGRNASSQSKLPWSWNHLHHLKLRHSERIHRCERGKRSVHESELNFRIRRTSRRRSEEHTSELQSQSNLVCRLLLEKKKYDN